MNIKEVKTMEKMNLNDAILKSLLMTCDIVKYKTIYGENGDIIKIIIEYVPTNRSENNEK